MIPRGCCRWGLNPKPFRSAFPSPFASQFCGVLRSKFVLVLVRGSLVGCLVFWGDDATEGKKTLPKKGQDTPSFPAFMFELANTWGFFPLL